MSQLIFWRQLALLLVLATTSTGAVDAPLPGARNQGVQITELPDKLRVEINGELFTEYFFTGKSHPWVSSTKKTPTEPAVSVTNLPRHVYFYPVLGPGGVPMTRDWPMKDVAGEEHDHAHHRSLWYAHGLVNGVDFWSEDSKAGRILHDKFLEIKSGRTEGVIKSQDKWVALDGTVVCTDERTFRVYARPNSERLFDFEITLKAGNDPIVLGDTKEGSMSIRIAESMRLSHGKGKPGAGHIVLSSGVRDEATWGKPAAWCDYYGPVNDKTVGIAIFDHPQNPRHPTTWHVRDYGLFAANPFGLHDFESSRDKTKGNLTIPAKQSATFRYRFYLHEGNEKQAKVAERYQEYVGAADRSK